MRKVYSILVDITSLPLLLGSYLILLSGYCLTKLRIIRIFTLGILSELYVCELLHLEELQLIVSLLAIIHFASGMNVLLGKIITRPKLRMISELIIFYIAVILTIQIIFIYLL